MAWKGGFEGNTKMACLCRYKYFVGMFWGCTPNNTGNGNSIVMMMSQRALVPWTSI